MLYAPNMILIGAASRDAGKTVFACELVRRFAADGVVGAKVTAVQETNGTCPRGGQGCGVCSSLEGDYCLTEELESGTEKDTQRLLASGAQRVFWLRVLKENLDDAAPVLLDTIGRRAPVICESNSLRRAIEPSLFFMLRRSGAQTIKASAEAVLHYADIPVQSDGHGFDVDFERLSLDNGRWIYRFPATAIILAGGRSTRMGCDKSMLDVGGRPMIAHVLDQVRPHFDQVLISAADPDKYAFLGARIVPDATPNAGPLAGIAAALDASDTDLNFVVSCDIPEIDVRLLRRLFRSIGDRDAAVPVVGETHTEPLFALYRRSALCTIREEWHAGRRDVRGAVAACDVEYMPVGDAGRIPNINTRDEYEAYLARRKEETQDR